MTSHSDDWSNVGPPPLTDEEAASMLKVLRETASEEPGPPPIGSKDKDLDDVGRSVIGAILAAGALGEALPPEVRLVEAEYFGEPSLAKIWWAIEAMWEREEPIDEVTVGSWLAINDEPKLVLLAVQLAGDCPSTMNLDHWARLLCEAGRKRQLSHKLGELSLRAGNGASFADVSAAIQDSLRGVEDMTRGGGLEHVSLPLKRVLAEIEAGTEDEPIAKTGLPALDVLTKLRAGELTIIAGRPSMGKSALAGNIAANCGRDIAAEPIALFSLEMPARQIIMRLLERELRLPEHEVLTAVREGRHVEAAARIHALNLHVDDRSGLSVADMRQALDGLKRVRLVILDYLQLARMDQAERHDLRVGQTTKQLKALAKDFHCNVIALCQLSRAVEAREDKRPQLSDLRDSGQIEEDADHVWMLYREGYYDRTGPDDTAEIRIAKQRHGQTGFVVVPWRAETQTFG